MYLPYDVSGADLDYYERYSFEHADFKTSPSHYMLDWAEQRGWNCRGAVVVRYACSDLGPWPRTDPTGEEATGLQEVVFFGRLEARKGLPLFVEAINGLNDLDFKVSFVGKNVNAWRISGAYGVDFIKQRLNRSNVKIFENFDQAQALVYLSRPGVIAVIPSALEHFPNTVIECLVRRIPFLASNVGGIPEVIEELGGSENHLFEPTVTDLSRRLENALSGR